MRPWPLLSPPEPLDFQLPPPSTNLSSLEYPQARPRVVKTLQHSTKILTFPTLRKPSKSDEAYLNKARVNFAESLKLQNAVMLLHGIINGYNLVRTMQPSPSKPPPAFVHTRFQPVPQEHLIYAQKTALNVPNGRLRTLYRVPSVGVPHKKPDDGE